MDEHKAQTAARLRFGRAFLTTIGGAYADPPPPQKYTTLKSVTADLPLDSTQQERVWGMLAGRAVATPGQVASLLKSLGVGGRDAAELGLEIAKRRATMRKGMTLRVKEQLTLEDADKKVEEEIAEATVLKKAALSLLAPPPASPPQVFAAPSQPADPPVPPVGPPAPLTRIEQIFAGLRKSEPQLVSVPLAPPVQFDARAALFAMAKPNVVKGNAPPVLPGKLLDTHLEAVTDQCVEHYLRDHRYDYERTVESTFGMSPITHPYLPPKPADVANYAWMNVVRQCTYYDGENLCRALAQPHVDENHVKSLAKKSYRKRLAAMQGGDETLPLY